MERSTSDELSWVWRFAELGYAIVPGLVDRASCAKALKAVRRRIGETRPLDAWDASAPGQRYDVIYEGECSAIDALWRRPRLLAALEELFGADGFDFTPPDAVDWRRHVALWINPYDPLARARYLPLGHVDSGNPYRGVAFLIALSGTEAFSGNTTFFPRSHKSLHEHLLREPDCAYPGGSYVRVERPDPAVEFVASGPGEVAFVHHLLFHSGNPSHSPHRLPRVALRLEAYSKRPPSMSRGGTSPLSPWSMSYAVATDVGQRRTTHHP
jgi:hypothetical protein